MTKNKRLNMMIAIIAGLMTLVFLGQAFNSMNMATSSKHSYDLAKQYDDPYSYKTLDNYEKHRNNSIIWFIVSGIGAIACGYNIHYVFKNNKGDKEV